MKQKNPTPLDEALERLESILGPASRWATTSHSITLALENPNFAAAILAKEPLIREAISESCEVWIDTGSLPLMDDEDAKFFFDRLRMAWKVGEWMRTAGANPNAVQVSLPVNEILHWLMVHSWEYICLPMWKDELRD